MIHKILIRVSFLMTLMSFNGISYAHKYHSADQTTDSSFSSQEYALKRKLNRAQQTTENAIELMNLYISQGNKTKKGIYYDKGIEVYRHFIKTNNFSSKATLLGAYLYQKIHHFKLALIELDKLIAVQPGSTNAWIMKAQIELTLGNLNAANKNCKELWALRAQLFASTCQAAVISMRGKPGIAYQILSQQIHLTQPEKKTQRKGYPHTHKRKNTSDHTSTSNLDLAWPVEVLTDIALQLNDPKILDNLLENALKRHPQSYYITINYADYLLSKNRNKKAYSILKNRRLSDPVLLRLLRVKPYIRSQPKKRLIARTLQQFNTEFNTGVKRGHHRELSYYHYYITKNYATAYKHARLNWRLQKELIDLRLLAYSAAKVNLLAQARQIAKPFNLKLLR